MKKSTGFTLIELIIVISVILLISILTILNYNSYTDKQRVKQAGMTLRSDLRLAQTKAMSGQKPFLCADATLESYDVVFSDCGNELACYKIQPICVSGGLAIDTSAEASRFSLPNSVYFRTAYPTIRFFPITGITDLTHDLSILLNGSNVTYTVTVTASGSISDY